MKNNKLSAKWMVFILTMFAISIWVLLQAIAYAEPVRIASFNIQVFGKAKASKAEVMDVLAKTIARFDIVAIQEIRDASGTAIKALEAKVDALGVDYSTIVGPRLGRTCSKEQYAYMFRTGFVQAGESYTYQEKGPDLIHREPFVGKFRTSDGFDFVLITAHLDPDAVVQEFAEFPTIIADVRNRFPDQQHILVMGDLNMDCRYYDEDSENPLSAPVYVWLIKNEMDTNVAPGNCTYDRLIATPSMAMCCTGNAGVFRFDLEFPGPDPKKVSDHFPVFAVFDKERMVE